jgi:hypothetical protein
MFGEQRESHEMILDIIHPTGVEEWYCPTCGQRFLLQWPPAYQKVFIEVGNQYASHSGGRMEAEQDQGEAAPSGENPASPGDGPNSDDERRLAEWGELLEEIGFDGWWR